MHDDPSAQAALALAAAVIVAMALDAAFGEPRNAWHPVAWLGRLMHPVGLAVRRRGKFGALLGGFLVWWAFALALGGGAQSLQSLLTGTYSATQMLLMGLLLKPALAWRMLADEVAAVGVALGQGVEPARARLAMLVSRDVSSFDDALLAETALETLAENLNDSVIAPLFWFAVAGLPGAWIYRFANTADAMWGYRGRWEWAGKWAARADDVLSWVPARLTALLLHLPRGRSGWRRLAREADRTPSPNGGWPMAALALHLGVRLRKPRAYALNEDARSPTRDDFPVAMRLARRAAWTAALLTSLVWLGRAAV